MLEQEGRALLTRLGRVKPFALQESMLPAANLLPDAQIVIERFLMVGRRQLREMVNRFLEWLHAPEGVQADPAEAQHRFTLVRLRFNAVLTQFDLFDNVITQRSESETGLWLSGLDVASADALKLNKPYFDTPPVICYLDRGAGAAIRRARTRIPGGGASPVAIIQVPRERMIGTGIASSLFHEVGHQASALLGLVESLRPELRAAAREAGADAPAWGLWERWISEIVADLWSAGRVGVAATMGLMGVVSLPRPFIFRLNPDDPHPAPWIRVKLSAAIGDALYPDPFWGSLVQLWESYYPRDGLGPSQLAQFEMLERTTPRLAQLLIQHRPATLQGNSLGEVLRLDELRPGCLRASLQRWRLKPHEMYRARPIVAFAAIGQGRADGTLTPEEEGVVLGKLLTHWALISTLDAAAGSAARSGSHCECQKHPQNKHGFETNRRTSCQTPSRSPGW